MYESYSIEQVTSDINKKLQDYSIFKKCVEFKQKTLKTAGGLLIFGLLLLILNARATYEIMRKGQIPMNHFLEIFFDSSNDGMNQFFFIASIVGLVVIGIAIILSIFGILTRETKFKKIYNEFISNPKLISKRLVLISVDTKTLSKSIKTTPLYYLEFENESDALKMLTLINENVFEEDKYYNEIIYATNENDSSLLSNHLIKNYNFSGEIKNVILSKFASDILKCNSGDFELFIDSKGLKLIKTSALYKAL